MKKRYLCLAIIAIAAAFVLIRPFHSLDQDAIATPSDPGPVPVFAVGLVEGARPDVGVHFEISGRVSSVLVEEGDHVRQGDTLAIIDPVERRFRCDLASARYAQATADYESARTSNPEDIRIAQADLDAKRALFEFESRTLDRLTELVAQGAIPDQEFEDQQARCRVLMAEIDAIEARIRRLQAPATDAQLSVLQAQINAALSQLELAELELERCTIIAPCDGVIVEVDIAVGEMIQPTGTRPAVIIVDDSRLRVRAFIEEADAYRVSSGQSVDVHFRDDFERAPLTGRVDRALPRFTQKHVMNRRPDERFDIRVRECWIELEDSRDLILGAHVDLLIHTHLNPSE